MNLLDNAVKSTPPGGRIDVRQHRQRRERCDSAHSRHRCRHPPGRASADLRPLCAGKSRPALAGPRGRPRPRPHTREAPCGATRRHGVRIESWAESWQRVRRALAPGLGGAVDPQRQDPPRLCPLPARPPHPDRRRPSRRARGPAAAARGVGPPGGGSGDRRAWAGDHPALTPRRHPGGHRPCGPRRLFGRSGRAVRTGRECLPAGCDHRVRRSQRIAAEPARPGSMLI